MRPAAFAYRDAGTCHSRQAWSRALHIRQPHGLRASVLVRTQSFRSWHLPLTRSPRDEGFHRRLANPLLSRNQFSSYASDVGHHEPTIYALSSAPGRAAIAVIRISGSACRNIYRALCPAKPIPKPRIAVVRTLYKPWTTPDSDTVLDSSALVLYFPGPATATGEDILELHVHGGPAVVKAVLKAISQCGSEFRYAERGEFTRRAFMNNRLDLTQVEALGDTLSADTEQQRRLSVRGTTGMLAKHYEAWRQQLLYARGELEALIDFSEDQHFDESPAELCASVAEQVQSLKGALQIHSRNAVRGELLRHGISVSLLGAPNAGKSSLLNRIVGREAAIVSDEAGTTRDVVEIGLDLGGYFCRFGDTAGLRQANSKIFLNDMANRSPDAINKIEQEGMRRAKARAADSDLVVVVLSFEQQDEMNNRIELLFDAEVCAFAQVLIQEKDNVIIVINKADLLTSPTASADAIRAVQDKFPGLDRRRVHMVSCIEDEESSIETKKDDNQGSGSGASDAKKKSPCMMQSADPGGRGAAAAKWTSSIQRFLRQGLIWHFGELTAALTDESHPDLSVWQESLGASERHRVLLDACISHLDAFLAEAAVPSGTKEHSGAAVVSQPEVQSDVVVTEPEGEEADIVVAAEHLRSAADCLAKITGKGESGDVEEVLGVVFEKFCVGK